MVALDELVHRAEAREQVVGRRGRAREEQLERRVVAAVAVELCGDTAGLVRGIQRRRGLLVGLQLQLVRAVGGVEVRLLRDVEDVGGLVGEGLLGGDLVGETWMSSWILVTSAALAASLALARSTSSHEG